MTIPIKIEQIKGLPTAGPGPSLYVSVMTLQLFLTGNMALDSFRGSLVTAEQAMSNEIQFQNRRGKAFG